MVKRRRPSEEDRCQQPQDDGLCESKPMLSWSFSYTILNLNVHGFLSHRAELEVHIGLLSRPSFISLTETFLTKLVNPVLSGYVLISRLDRRSGKTGGGIALFVRVAIAAQVVHIGDSYKYERSWHIIHVDTGPILFCVWYRPPCKGEVQFIVTLEEELVYW